MRRILEAGHYYQAKGPTAWAQIGWGVMHQFKTEHDRTMLFVDDFHGIEHVSEYEQGLMAVPFCPQADYVVSEKGMKANAHRVLDLLSTLPAKKKAKQNGDGRWFCSGLPLTNHEHKPSCVLLDAGLTLHKHVDLGFASGINILPWFYEAQQQQLMRIIRKIMPDFTLSVVLFDLQGSHWHMQEQ